MQLGMGPGISITQSLLLFISQTGSMLSTAGDNSVNSEDRFVIPGITALLYYFMVIDGKLRQKKCQKI